MLCFASEFTAVPLAGRRWEPAIRAGLFNRTNAEDWLFPLPSPGEMRRAAGAFFSRRRPDEAVAGEYGGLEIKPCASKKNRGRGKQT